jgi:hypothetical protein
VAEDAHGDARGVLAGLALALGGARLGSRADAGHLEAVVGGHEAVLGGEAVEPQVEVAVPGLDDASQVEQTRW